jgi:hypothetical protein
MDWSAMSPDEDLDDRRWWMPILVGVLALLLLGVLLVAGWVIIDAVRPNPPAPPPAATSAGTPAPTSAVPTTTPPTTPATTSPTPDAGVVVPTLVGLPAPAARVLLEQYGLTPELRFVPSDEPAGTVVATDPEAGTEVAPGDVIVLVVAEPRVPTPPTGPTRGPTGPGSPTVGRWRRRGRGRRVG